MPPHSFASQRRAWIDAWRVLGLEEPRSTKWLSDGRPVDLALQVYAATTIAAQAIRPMRIMGAMQRPHKIAMSKKSPLLPLTRPSWSQHLDVSLPMEEASILGNRLGLPRGPLKLQHV